MRSLLIALVLLCVAPASADPAPTEPLPAATVLYGGVDTGREVNAHMHCESQQGYGESLWGSGVSWGSSRFEQMLADLWVFPRTSTGGSMLDAGDRHIVYSQEGQEDPAFGYLSYGMDLRENSYGPEGRNHFVFAVWGGDVSCTLLVNGADVPLTALDGRHAVYVGAHAFRGGVLYQDGSQQASAGRTFSTEFAEPSVVMANLHVGDRRLPGDESGQGFIATDSPPALDPVTTCSGGGGCNASSLRARTLVAGIGAGLAEHHAQQLWLVDIPRSVAFSA